MKSLLSLLLVLLSVSFFVGCSEDAVEPATYTIQDVFPLSVGKQSTYHNEYYKTDGTVSGRDTVILIVDSTTIFNGIPAYAVHSYEKIIYYYSGTDAYGSFQSTPKPSLFLRYPMAINETLTLRDTTLNGGYRSKTILRYVGDNVSVTVPAGTFSCLHYQNIGFFGEDTGALDTSSRADMYLAIGIGFIKEDGIQKSLIDSVWRPSYSSQLASYIK